MLRNHLIILLITIPCITVPVTANGFTESHTTELVNGRIVKANERLVYVSVRKGFINLTSSDPDFTPCQLDVDEDLSHNWDTTALGNGKIIVWNQKYREGGENFAHWKIFIIDPIKCTSTAVTKVPEDCDSLNKINTVIPYRNSFDVFSQVNECSPCRFKDTGESIDLPESTYKPLQLPKEYGISPLGDNASTGYLLTQKFDNCTTLLKILSPTFEVLKEQLINRNLEAVSTDHDHIRVCSSSNCLGEANITHDCQLLDVNLRTEKPLERITEKEYSFLEIVQNLPDGGAVTAYVSQEGCFQGDGEGAFGDVHVKRIRADGQVDADLKFETLMCWEYYFQNFLMRDGRYCLATYDGGRPSKYQQTVFIKCLKYNA